MILTELKKDMVELTFFNDRTFILFSYNIPVVVVKNRHIFVSNRKHSPETEEHIEDYMDYIHSGLGIAGQINKVDHDVIDSFYVVHSQLEVPSD